MPGVVVYTTSLCPYCILARRLLRRRRIGFEEHRMRRDSRSRAQLSSLSEGGRTYPQIVVEGRALGGYSELRDLDRSGELRELIAAE